MTDERDTPIVEAALEAYWATPSGKAGDRLLAALRAALPWDLPAERLEAMARATDEMAWLECSPPAMMPMERIERKSAALAKTLAAYRADPIMRELYPEQFR